MIQPATGFWLWLLDRIECDGITMPWRKVYIRPDCLDDDGLRAHEMMHLVQISRYGPIRFSILYLWQLLRYGYDRMPLEIEAREVQQEIYDRAA